MDTYDRLPKIKIPTLILAGEDDPIISSNDSKILAKRIPNAQLKIFKGFGHGFFREVWHQTLTEILSFLSKLASIHHYSR
jgi:pimeloyl-ACP methyl ester carboxylesterase